MNKGLSLYLDVIRFFAALAVVLEHVSRTPFTDGTVWWRLTDYGQTAVVVFFVLSGFVIAYVVEEKERTLRDYMTARFSRLYSVAFLVLPLTYVLDFLTFAIDGELIREDAVWIKDGGIAGFLSALFFVNEWQLFGFDGIAPGTNAPYWSLSFEFAYYMAAAGLALSRNVKGVVLATLVMCAAGSTVLALAPLWALGWWAYHVKVQWWPRSAAMLLFVVSSLGVLHFPRTELPILGQSVGLDLPWGVGNWQRHLVLDYLIGSLFFVHLLAARKLFGGNELNVPRFVAESIRFLGRQTFPLYACHYPVICFVSAVTPFALDSLSQLLFLFLVLCLFVVPLTMLSDRLRQRLRTRGADLLLSLLLHVREKYRRVR